MAQFSTFASAGQIYHAVIASCLNEELAILPKETFISQLASRTISGLRQGFACWL